MRHRKSGRQLNRNSSHRKAMLKNMTCSLFEHEFIRTTVPKARELRRVAEPLITLAKADSVANRRLAFARVGSKAVVGKLFKELGVRYQERPGGYTRILKSGFRPGDAAPMAFIELVDRPMPDDDDIDNADNNFVAPDDDKVIEVAPTEDTKPAVEQEGWFKRLRKRFLK